VRLRKQVYIYFITYSANAGLSFVTVSLLTHYLAPYDYGIINLYSSFLIFLMPFISGGILYPLSVEYFKRPEASYKEFFTDAQVIPLISLLLFTLICIIFQHQIGWFLKVPVLWVWIIPVTVWWIVINEITMIITRNKNKPLQFAFFSTGKNLTEIVLTVGFVIGAHWAWQGRLLSAALAALLLSLISIYLFSKWNLIVKKTNWINVRKIFLLSLPFVFERLAVFVLGYSDKYFIDRFDLNGTSEVGLYGLGSQIAGIVYMIVISFNSAYLPYLFKKLSEGFKGKIHKTTYWYIFACTFTVLGLFITIPLLFHFFIGTRFQNAKPYAYMLSTGYLMWGVYNAFLGYLVYLEKNRQILLISLFGMITSLCLNIFLVPVFGAEGAAVTSIATYTIMAIICFLYFRKYFILES
jgi:O-antigen/teichoic acid export membrane protein